MGASLPAEAAGDKREAEEDWGGEAAVRLRHSLRTLVEEPLRRSASIDEQANEPEQQETLLSWRCCGRLLRNGAAAEHRRCNLQRRVSWSLLLSSPQGLHSHQNRLGCLNAVVVYAQQLAGRGVCVNLSLLDHEDESRTDRSGRR